MTTIRSLLRPCAGALLIGISATWAAAQVELPPLQTSGSSRRALEKPKSYEPTTLPSATVYSRGSSRGTSKIPDPGIFDGTDFPEEERPEQAQIAQFENPGGQPPPSTKDVKGPGDKKGGGGQGPGGDGGQQGGGGPQLAGGPQIPGLPPIMGGGGGAGSQPGMPPPPLPEGDQGDAGQPGGSGEGEPGEEGQEGNGKAGAEGAPDAAGQEGRALDKPSEMQIGDEGAKLAEADLPQTDPSRQLESKPGEDRMSVKAASGNQPSNRGKGTERGVDIPSNL